MKLKLRYFYLILLCSSSIILADEESIGCKEAATCYVGQTEKTYENLFERLPEDSLIRKKCTRVPCDAKCKILGEFLRTFDIRGAEKIYNKEMAKAFFILKVTGLVVVDLFEEEVPKGTGDLAIGARKLESFIELLEKETAMAFELVQSLNQETMLVETTETVEEKAE
jgi:hypothetical protein